VHDLLLLFPPAVASLSFPVRPDHTLRVEPMRISSRCAASIVNPSVPDRLLGVRGAAVRGCPVLVPYKFSC